MAPRLPLCLLGLVYAIYISCLVCGEKKGLMNQEFEPAEEEKDCNITVMRKSAEYLMVKFYQFDPDVAYLTLKFPNNSVVQYNEQAIQPFRWILTFEGKDRKLPFLGWDLDYAILSAGLLKEKALPESWVEFDVQPPNCSITIGKRKSNLEIAYAFSNMTNIVFHYVGSMYNNHYADSKNHSWCFAAEIPGSKDTFWYLFGKYWVYPVDFTQYNCCFSYYDFIKKEINVKCSDNQIDIKWVSTPGLNILGLIIFCYAPIFICDFISNSSGKEMEGNDKFMQLRDGYISLDGMDNNENINDEDNFTSDFVYLTKHSPITLLSIISECCFQSKQHPLRASRLRRTLFICVCPILVYIQLGIYGIQMGETTHELIKHGAPINFLTMLAGFERSRELFVPLLGGPYVLIFMFHVLGIVLLVLPENFENLLEDPRSYIGLGFDLVKRFSHLQIEEERGYGRLRLLMLARFRCILNPAFWLHVYHMCLAECKGCLTPLRNRLPTFLCCFLFFISAPILFLAFFIVLFGHCVWFGHYFGTPWFCISSPFIGLYNLWIQKFRDTFAGSCTAIERIICLFFVLFVSYFTFSLMIIIIHGIFFVTRVIIFLFTAALVYPSAAFVNILFFASLFHYFIKQIGRISDDYFELLSDIVKSIKVLETEPNQLRVVDNTLIVPNGQNETIQRIQIKGTTIKLSEEQLQSIRTSSTHVSDRLIRYKNKVPGIPRELFLCVVRKHRPVFITLFKALFPIFLILISIPQVIIFISYISTGSSQVTDVMNVVSVVFIVFLPRIIEMSFSGSNKAVLTEIFQKQLETSILEYQRLVQTAAI